MRTLTVQLLNPGRARMQELTGYDIFTYHFGDAFRLYLRGQFAAHRNSPKARDATHEAPFTLRVRVRAPTPRCVF